VCDLSVIIADDYAINLIRFTCPNHTHGQSTSSLCSFKNGTVHYRVL